MMLISSPPVGPCSDSHSLPDDRIPRQPLRVAMAVAPDRREHVGPVHERVVLGNRAVVVDAVHLAERRGQILGVGHLAALADGEEQVAVAVEDESCAEVRIGGGVGLRLGAEQDLLLDPLVLRVDLAADDHGVGGVGRCRRRRGRGGGARIGSGRCRRRAGGWCSAARGAARRRAGTCWRTGARSRAGRTALPPSPWQQPGGCRGRGGRRRGIVRARLGIRQVNPAILGVLRMNLDVEQPAILAFPDRRRAGHGGRQQLTLLPHAQAARPLGDEESAIGQEGQAPGRLEVAADDLDLERLLLGLDDLTVRVGDVDRLRFEIRRGGPHIGHELPDLRLGELIP